MGIFFNNKNAIDMITLQEAYFGKAKCKKIEEAISVARKPYIGHKFGKTIGYYGDENFINVGKAIKNVFGFYQVDFNISPDSAPNAFTYAMSRSISGSNIRAKVKNGMITYNDNSYANLVVRVTSGMWADEKFSDAEITAIVLHEIGHNFSNNVSTQLQSYNTILSFCSILSMCSGDISALINDPSIKTTISDVIKSSPFLSLFAGTTNMIVAIVKYIIYVCISSVDYFGLGTLASVVYNWVLNPIGSIINTFLNTYNKGEEFSSDKFAAECGYGAELSTALMKMELNKNPMGTNIEKVVGQIPILGHIHNFMSIPVSICLSPFSSHPITPKRINNIISELELELKKDKSLSPEMKKEIRKNIEATKEAVAKYTVPKGDTLDFNRKWFINYIKKGKGAGIATKNISKHDILDDMMDESAIFKDDELITESELKGIGSYIDNIMNVLESLDNIYLEKDAQTLYGCDWNF